MQVVILAAGRGIRMGNHTELTPKPLLKIKNKTLLEYKLDFLPEKIKEVILVVGYRKSDIYQYLGKVYKGIPLRYVEQSDFLGTADALWQAKDILNEHFLVMMGDDIYHPSDIRSCTEHSFSIGISKVNNLYSGGKVVFDEFNRIKEIKEGNDHGGVTGYLNTGLYSMTDQIFSCTQQKLSGKEEWGLPQTLLQLANKKTITPVFSRFWLQITTPIDLKKAEDFINKYF